MPKTVKYIGTVTRWPELATTGKQSTWVPGQQEQRSDTEAAQLLATGLFSDVDATQLPEQKVVAISGVVSGARDIGSMVEPFCIAHRGAGSQIAPEGTIAALQLSATFGDGYVIDTGDWYSTADGAIFDCHSSTLSDVTNLTGTMATKTANQMRRATLDVTRWYPGFGNSDQAGVLGPDDVFPRFRGLPQAPEPKTQVAAEYLATYLAAHGLQNKCLVNAFWDSYFAPFVAKGFPYLCRNVPGGAETATLAGAVTGPVRADAIKALGCNYVLLDVADANFLPALAVARAAGLKAGAYTSFASTNLQLIKQSQRQNLEGLGLSFYVADDPLYFMGDVAKYRRTSDPYQLSAGVYHGHHDRGYTRPPTTSTRRGSIVGGKLRLTNIDTFNNFILQGWACPLENAAATYTLSIGITFVSLPADLTRWVAVAICTPTDAPFHDAGAAITDVRQNSGYMLIIVPNAGSGATLSMIRKTDGASANIGPTPLTLSGAISAGQSITLTVTVTPTTITAVVSGAVTGSMTAVPDATHRGAYFHCGHGSLATGNITVDFGPITVT